MKPRQTRPGQWLIAAARSRPHLALAFRRLPRGSGIVVLDDFGSAVERRRLKRELRRKGTGRGRHIVEEGGRGARRVHDSRELRQALLTGASLILLSPLFETRSHPGQRPLPRMRAAALARLGKGRLVALGGMNAQRFRQIRRMGFDGWAAIDAWTR